MLASHPSRPGIPRRAAESDRDRASERRRRSLSECSSMIFMWPSASVRSFLRQTVSQSVPPSLRFWPTRSTTTTTPERTRGRRTDGERASPRLAPKYKRNPRSLVRSLLPPPPTSTPEKGALDRASEPVQSAAGVDSTPGWISEPRLSHRLN